MIHAGTAIIDARFINRERDPKTQAQEIQAATKHTQDFARNCILNVAENLQLGVKDNLLVIPGNHDVYRYASSKAAKLQLYAQTHRLLDKTSTLLHVDEMAAADLDNLAYYPRLILFGDDHGVLAVFGLDSNHTAYSYKGLSDYGLVYSTQLNYLTQAIVTLQEIFKNTPLYVWVVLHHHLLQVESFNDVRRYVQRENKDGVDYLHKLMLSVTLDSRDIIEKLQDCRVSLVTHGHMHHPVMQQMLYRTLQPGRGRSLLNIVACPSFILPERNEPQDEYPYVGVVVLTLKKYHGSMQVDILADIEEEDFRQSVTVPMLSASRCSAGEMRVLREIRAWLDEKVLNDRVKIPISPGDGKAEFKDVMERRWKEHAYTQVAALPEGIVEGQSVSFPAPRITSELPQKSYRLLLVLKEDGGDPYILLNNHISVRQSSFGTWHAPLLPAFSDVRDFLERLRVDIHRIVGDVVIGKPASSRQHQQGIDELRDTLVPLPRNSYTPQAVKGLPA